MFVTTTNKQKPTKFMRNFRLYTQNLDNKKNDLKSKEIERDELEDTIFNEVRRSVVVREP